MPWWIREIKKDYRYFFSKLFKYIKTKGWNLPEVSKFELLAGRLSLYGSVSGLAYDSFKKRCAH